MDLHAHTHLQGILHIVIPLLTIHRAHDLWFIRLA